MSRTYDLAFLEELNDLYRDRPIYSPDQRVDHVVSLFTAPAWSRQAPDAAERRARIDAALEQLATSDAVAEQTLSTRSSTERKRTARKLRAVLLDVGLAGRDVLELGCGNGWLTMALVEAAGARSAVGIDVDVFPDWEYHRDDRLRFLAGDLSAEALIADGSVDVVVSSVVFEHVTRPLQMLAALHRVLRPGGNAWLRFNLYTARNASHRYRDILFPWPHLLFENSVCEEFYRNRTGRPKSFSWVNKMTIAHYLQASRDAGFDIEIVRLARTPIDLEFYRRCEDKLGQFLALDLECDFMTLVMTKADGPPRDVPPVGYLEAQCALEEALRGQSPVVATGG